MEAPRSIHVASLVQFVLHAGVEVIGAVRRSGMHRPGALIRSDVLRENSQNLAVKKWMRESRVLHFASRKSRDLLRAAQFRAGHGCLSQRIGYDVNLTLVLQGNVVQLGMKRYRHGR